MKKSTRVIILALTLIVSQLYINHSLSESLQLTNTKLELTEKRLDSVEENITSIDLNIEQYNEYIQELIKLHTSIVSVNQSTP